MRLDLAVVERFDRLGDGEIGLAGAGRAYGDDEIAFVDRFQEPALIVGAWADVAGVAAFGLFAVVRRPTGARGKQGTDFRMISEMSSRVRLRLALLPIAHSPRTRARARATARPGPDQTKTV